MAMQRVFKERKARRPLRRVDADASAAAPARQPVEETLDSADETLAAIDAALEG